VKKSLVTRGLAALLLGSTLAATGCVGAQKAAAQALISDDQERQLGLQVKRDLETKQNVKYVQDPAVVDYVRGITQKITPQAAKDRKGVNWQVNVIDDPKTVNAFATPGGFLYVYSGLILAAENEAELAGVMGHEVAHVTQRHSARQMVTATGLNAVVGAAAGKNPGAVTQIAAGLLGTGSMLHFSRSMETEADIAGVRYMAGANYNPDGLATFFNKLAAGEGKVPGFLKYASTHPPSAERVRDVREYVREHHLRGSEVGADRLAAVKARLQK
jgi:beta-barrel assembly-enhancing protease